MYFFLELLTTKNSRESINHAKIGGNLRPRSGYPEGCVTSDTLLHDFGQRPEGLRQTAFDLCIVRPDRETAGGTMHASANRRHGVRHELGHVRRAMRIQRRHTEPVFGNLGGLIIGA